MAVFLLKSPFCTLGLCSALEKNNLLSIDATKEMVPSAIVSTEPEINFLHKEKSSLEHFNNFVNAI